MGISDQKFTELQQELKGLYVEAMIDIKKCYELLTQENGNKKPEFVLPILNDATSYVNTMRALYITFDELSHQEFDEFFHLYEVFKDEVLTNFSTDHSHQWSLIEHERLMEWAVDLGSLLGVKDPSYFVPKDE